MGGAIGSIPVIGPAIQSGLNGIPGLASGGSGATNSGDSGSDASDYWALSVHNGHSEPIFQYLSDLGAIPSEANIFSLVMATEAVLGVIFVFIRYAATKSYIYFNNNNITDNNQGQLKSLNKWSLVFGITLVWGLIGIASFRSGREGMV
ncbi:unnamed protein product, partial [Oppiella nova]